MTTLANPAPPPLIAALMESRHYPYPATTIELIETHISWVLLAGEFAYKIKKPVALGFLDFSTLEARRHFCNEELRLNRAIAPQLYLEVLPITGTAAAPQFGGDGLPFEYALRMRRFAQDDLLDHKVRCGAADAALFERLAATIAAFHARTAVAAADSVHGSPANITQPARENFEQIAALMPPDGSQEVLSKLRAWTASESARLETVFLQRKAGGRVRECHGDLHLGNIAVIDGVPVLFDCIEFNPEFRWIDVSSEIAFLVMDLLDRDLAALAWRCLNRYLEISGDYAGLEVLRYYLVYRAMVRAKVALLHARQPVAGAVRRGDEKSFLHHVQLAARLAAPPRPALVLMHGVTGSGKSTVAQELLAVLGAVRVRSDVERKRLYGLPAEARSGSAPGAGIYDAAATQRTYARLAEVASGALRSGWRVIVDAASLQRQQRDLFRQIARDAGVPFVLLSCHAERAVLRERLARRAAAGGDASEATLEVLEQQIAAGGEIAADEAADVIVCGSADHGADLLARLLSRIDGAG